MFKFFSFVISLIHWPITQTKKAKKKKKKKQNKTKKKLKLKLSLLAKMKSILKKKGSKVQVCSPLL
jgi:hypothetical protein